MRRSIMALAVLLFSFLSVSYAEDKLTKEDVVALVKQGVPEDDIVWKLERTGSEFKLTDNDRKWLKEQGVSSWVSIVMDMTPKARKEKLPIYYGPKLTSQDIVNLTKKGIPSWEIPLMIAHTQSKFTLSEAEKNWLKSEGVQPIVIMLMETQTEKQAQKPFLARGKIERGGQPIRGGKYYDDAVSIAPGSYRLDHQLKTNEFDYFKVRLKNGQKLTCWVRTTDISDSGGIGIHSPERTAIIRADIYGKNAKRNCYYYVFDAPGGEKDLYILMGNDYSTDDAVIYDIAVDELYDASSGKDAGSYFDAPLAITAGEHTCYAPSGDADMYVMKVKKGRTLTVKLIPDNPAGYFRAVLYSESREALAEKWNSPGSVLTVSAANKSATDENFYIKVDRSGDDPVGKYVLKVEAK